MLNIVMWYFSHVVQQVNRFILLRSSKDSKKGLCVYKEELSHSSVELIAKMRAAFDIFF